ncbi:hypothetical protein IW262DRAFT_516967 [Armillaria fumosa]|nr:hypothetical protein IW262DRAFT_516967 [Armillaria fumosa]
MSPPAGPTQEKLMNNFIQLEFCHSARHFEDISSYKPVFSGGCALPHGPSGAPFHLRVQLMMACNGIFLPRWITGKIGMAISCGQADSKHVKPKITAGHVVPPTRTMTYHCDLTILLVAHVHHSSEILTVSVPVIMCCRSPSMLLPRYLSLIPHAGSCGNVEVPLHTSLSRKLSMTSSRTSSSPRARVFRCIKTFTMDGR